MKSKKMLAILMASVMAFMGTGCGTQSDNNNKTAAPVGSETASEKTDGTGKTDDSNVPTIKIGQITNLTGSGAQSGNLSLIHIYPKVFLRTP